MMGDATHRGNGLRMEGRFMDGVVSVKGLCLGPGRVYSFGPL